MSPLFPDEAARSGWDWSELPPDPVVEYYKQFVNRAALRENLNLTFEQRIEKMQALIGEQQKDLANGLGC